MKKEKNLILISSMAILLTALLECMVIVMKPNMIAIIAIGICMLINVFILLSNILQMVEERHEEHLQEEAQLISQLQMLSKKIDRRLELLERVGKANYTATNRIREAQTNCFSVTNSLLDEVKHNQFQAAQLIAKYNAAAHNKNLEDRHRQIASLLKCLDQNLENLSLGEVAAPPALPDFNVDFGPVIDTLENGFITVGERLEQLQNAALASAQKTAAPTPAAAEAISDGKPEPDTRPELITRPEPAANPTTVEMENITAAHAAPSAVEMAADIENVTPNAVVTEINPVTEPDAPASVPTDISEQAEHLAAALETIPQISVVPDEPVIEYIPEPEPDITPEPDIIPEPVPIPIAKQEPTPAPSDDPGHIMSPAEIAALISGAGSEPEPKPEPAPAPSNDPGHIMSPDEIAALISGTGSEPAPESKPEPAPSIKELKPLDEDPNRSLTADEIAALFSNG